MKAATSLTMVVVTSALLACFGPVAPAGAYPPDPDNAALLYYQSFLLYKAPDFPSFDDFVKGTTGPNAEIRGYLQKGRSALDYALLAVEREQCNWGVVYSKGVTTALPHLAQCRSLARLMLAEARLFAAEGRYQEALERCLSVKKLARHVGDELMISLLVWHAVDALADDCLRDILGMMPPEAQVLEWLKGRLATAFAGRASVVKGLKIEQGVFLETMQMDRLPELMEILQGSVGQPAPRLPAKIDEEFLAQNRAYYVRCMTAMQAILAGPRPYAEKWSALQATLNQLTQDAEKGTGATLAAALVPALGKVSSIDVRAEARANALRVGLELLTVKAQKGQLPERLPANLLKDPFSDRDYLYRKTAAGFVLRCQGKDLDKDLVYEWEFKVK